MKQCEDGKLEVLACFAHCGHKTNSSSVSFPEPDVLKVKARVRNSSEEGVSLYLLYFSRASTHTPT